VDGRGCPFTRLVLLEIRANARTSAEACRAAIDEGRIDTEAKSLLDERGSDFFETYVAVAFSKIEEAFEQAHLGGASGGADGWTTWTASAPADRGPR
jgi:hypothetical protein